MRASKIAVIPAEHRVADAACESRDPCRRMPCARWVPALRAGSPLPSLPRLRGREGRGLRPLGRDDTAGDESRSVKVGTRDSHMPAQKRHAHLWNEICGAAPVCELLLVTDSNVIDLLSVRVGARRCDCHGPAV